MLIPEGMYRCKHTVTHGNLGRIFTKGCKYPVRYEKPKVLDCDYVLVGNKGGGFRTGVDKFYDYFEPVAASKLKHKE